LAEFRDAARRRHQQEQRALALKERRAWELARSAAALLREQFHVERIAVFGSLVHPGCFTAWSDVDLAAWGLQPADTLRAMGLTMDIEDEIAVNIDVATCSPSLLRMIEQEGVPL
jgi:predicted nucleotidyltransferase